MGNKRYQLGGERCLTLWRSPVLPFPTGFLDFPRLPKLMKTKCNLCQAFEKAKPTNVHKTHTIGAVFSSLVDIYIIHTHESWHPEPKPQSHFLVCPSVPQIYFHTGLMTIIPVLFISCPSIVRPYPVLPVPRLAFSSISCRPLFKLKPPSV